MARDDNYHEVLNRLYPLFDVKSVSSDETKIFKGVPHDDISSAVIQWIESSRIVLIEPINIQDIQSRRDQGVDVLLHFLTSEFSIGFQIKK